MKNRVLSLLLCLISITICAQDLKPFKDWNSKWGYKDKAGKTVIEGQYDKALTFSEGVAAIRLGDKWDDEEGFYYGGKWGFIDEKGKVVIPLKFDNVSDGFFEGLAAVQIGRPFSNTWGFIDKTGKEAIALKYSGVGRFSEGLAIIILNGKYGFVDKTGKEIIPLKYNYAKDFQNGRAEVTLEDKKFYIDKTGKEVK